MLCQPFSELQRRGTPCEIFQQVVQLRLKARICASFCVRALEVFERGHERFGNISPAIRAKTPARVRNSLRCHACIHFRLPRASRTAAIKPRSFFMSFLPGAASTPLQTSTANG